MSVKAFVSFPSEYTHNSVIRAFKKYLPDVELVFNRPSDVVDIQYADCKKSHQLKSLIQILKYICR